MKTSSKLTKDTYKYDKSAIILRKIQHLEYPISLSMYK
jgi:hypothetical protein